MDEQKQPEQVANQTSNPEQAVNPIFEKKKSVDDKGPTPYETLSKNVTSAGSRLRVLEERYSNIRKKTQMTDQSMLEFERDMRNEIRGLNQDLLDIKREFSEVKDSLLTITSEMKSSVKQNEFKVIEKYVDMWQPMNFVTREEFEKYLRDKE